jgi:hypothetical protein
VRWGNQESLFKINTFLCQQNTFKRGRVEGMVLNATFNNISVISWWSSVLLVEETEYIEKTTDLPQATDKLYYGE